MSAEKTPLLGASPENKGYYFLDRQGGTTSAVRDGDGGRVVDEIPAGTTADEFAPRVLTPRSGKTSVKPSSQVTSTQTQTQTQTQTNGSSSKPSIVQKLFGTHKTNDAKSSNTGKLIKQRKAPVKVEPKVFFANERTFLAWLHISIILAGGSIAILAFADEQNPSSQLYGIVLLPVAVAFIVYAMHQYGRRAYMIRNKHPGPYEDTVGPTVLGVMLMISIVAQFAIKLYSINS